MQKDNASKTTIHTIYKQLVKKLSVIFQHEKTINLLKTDDIFKKTIKDNINVILNYETKYKKNDNRSKEFLNAYKSITSKTIKLAKLDLKDLDGIEDTINSITFILKNVLKMSWDDIYASFSAKKDQKALNTTDVEEIESYDAKPINDHEIPKNNSSASSNGSSFNNYNKPFDAETFINRSGTSVEDIANNLINQQADQLLYRDIVQNKFYQYDSKPKLMVWLKLAFFGMTVLFFLMLLISIIINWVYSSKTYPNIDNWFFLEIPVADKDSKGVAFKLPFTQWLLFFLIMICGGFYISNYIKRFKNDNVKYSFSIAPVVFIGFFFFLNFLMGFINNSPMILLFEGKIQAVQNLTGTAYVQIDANGTLRSFHFTNSVLYPLVLGAAVTEAIQFFTVIITIVFGISVNSIKPKKDIEKIKELKNKYINGLKNGTITFDGGPNNGFGTGRRNPFSPF